MNLYGFAEGDPINHSDPFGLCPVVLALAGPAGVAVAAGWCAAEVATIGTGIWLATKQAKGIQRTETSLGIAEEHLGRIGGLGPDDEDPEGKKRDWLKHARKHLNNAEKYIKDVKGKTQEELKRRLDEVARQIDRLSSPQ